MNDTGSNLILSECWICRCVKVELVWQLTILPSNIQLLPEIHRCMRVSCRGEEASYLSGCYLTSLVVNLGSGLGETGRLVVRMSDLLFHLRLRSRRGLDSGCASSAAHICVLIQ